MAHEGTSTRSNQVRTTGFYVAASVGAALLVSATAALFISTPANAKPEFAAQTGKPCGTCHTNPTGGGALKPFGEKFKANGNKMPK
jgi:hypothetical protein